MVSRQRHRGPEAEFDVIGNVRSGAILVDYYPGGYGATILIDIHSEMALATLRTTFLDLANWRRHSVDLLRLDSVFRSASIEALELRVASGIHDLEGELARASTASINRFVWTKSPDGWLQAVDLIDALAAVGGPGHQYFIEPPSIPAVIVLQFME